MHNLSERIREIVLWVAKNPGCQAENVLKKETLRMAEQMGLVYWRGPVPQKGWYITTSGRMAVGLMYEG